MLGKRVGQRRAEGTRSVHMKTVAVIQARMAATRLPGKVMRRIGNHTVLGHLLRRLQNGQHLAGVLVAATDHPEDEAIAEECARYGVECYRGDHDDVLSRFYGAASEYRLENLVRITADCPLYDPFHLDDLVQMFHRANRESVTVDYLTNCTLKRTMPRGLDTEIFTFTALERAYREANQRHEREHVTPYIYLHPDRFQLRSWENEKDLSGHRWVLDTPEDLIFVETVFEALDEPDTCFRTGDILRLLGKRPDLTTINAGVEQKHADNKFREFTRK